MNKEQIIIIGSSGHAKVIIDIIEKSNQYEIAGLTNANPIIGETVLDYNILGTDDDLASIIDKHTITNFFIAIGDNWTRKNVQQKIIAQFPKAAFPTLIHPSAQIANDVTIGEGTVIMAGAIINTSSTIGDFVIINTKSSIDHDNKIDNFASIGPNATTGGNVSIGEFSVLGLSTSIKHGIAIGKNCIIGSAAFLNKNCDDNMVMFGLPAKFIKSRVLGEKYL